MYACLRNWVAIGHAVVCYARLPWHLVKELYVGTVSILPLYYYMLTNPRTACRKSCIRLNTLVFICAYICLELDLVVGCRKLDVEG